MKSRPKGNAKKSVPPGKAKQQATSASDVAGQELKQAVLNSLDAHVAIIDGDGTIIDANEPWIRFAVENGIIESDLAVGHVNYLDIYRNAQNKGDISAAEILQGIRDVLGGIRSSYQTDYPYNTANGEDWFTIKVIKLIRSINGAVISHENITERKKVESALRESQEHLTEAQRVANLGFYVLDVAAGLWKSSEILDEIFGIDTTYKRDIGSWIQIVHPDQREEMLAYLTQHVLKEHRPFNREYRIARIQDGQTRWVHGRGDLAFSPDDEPIRMFGTIMDITERKQVEDELRKSEERFRSLYENATIGLYRTTPDGQIMLSNPTLVRMLGYSSFDELAQRNLDQEGYEPGYERSIFRQQIENNGLVMGLESSWTRKDGTIIFVRESAKAISDVQGKVKYYEGTVEDITERKRAEEALRESEALYRLAIETAGAVPYREIYHYEGNPLVEYQFIGEGIRQITGYGPEEFNAKLWEELVLEMHPLEELAVYSIDEAVERVRSGKNPLWKCDFKIRARDGTIRWVFEAAVELRDENGISHGSIGMYQDITARMQAEEQLRSSEERFRQLADNIEEAFWMTEPFTGKQIYLSPAASRIWGRDINELSESLNVFIDAVLPEDRPLFMSMIAKQRSGESTTMEYRIRRPDGAMRWIWDRAFPILDENSKVFRVAGLAADITERKLSEARIQTQLQRLSALSAIDTAISASLDINLTLNIFLGEIRSQLNVDAADVLLLNSFLQTLEYAAGQGFRTSRWGKVSLPLGKGLAGVAAVERQTIHIPNLEELTDEFTRTPLHTEEGFITYIGLPLITKGQLKGVLEIFSRTRLNPDLEWLDYLKTLAAQASIAIDNAQLFDSLQRTNFDLVMAYDATITGWSRAMDLRDEETEGHTQRVTEITLRLAERMGISEQEQVQIRRGALLHDIGKLAVPDHILNKPDQLNDEEWSVMYKHPAYAYEMLTPIAYLKSALDIPYCHHEKWDGSGYPRGLKGEQIPLAARLFAIVDVWDALRSDRPYRKAWSREKVLRHIQEEAGKHFDPQVVNIFLDFVRSESDDIHRYDGSERTRSGERKPPIRKAKS